MSLPSRPLARPRVFAHRGGATLAPENTIAAFDRGLSIGADGFELDVHLSRDGVPVVHHDATLDRTTDTSGPLAARTADELSRVDAACRFGPEQGYPFRDKGYGVPRLHDVLVRYPDVRVIIELKGEGAALAQRTIEEVRATNAVARVAIGSYSAGVLRAARRCEPRISTGAAPGETRCAIYRSWIGMPHVGVRYREFQVPERAGGTRIVSP
ncbi:MAG: hypothetical protein LC804_13290, partial [Acidobacteria bacterium]|nr:hypothetical protein [Acidobacteriota bacterium]